MHTDCTNTQAHTRKRKIDVWGERKPRGELKGGKELKGVEERGRKQRGEQPSMGGKEEEEGEGVSLSSFTPTV